MKQISKSAEANYRDLFGSMPELKHDRDESRSDVLRHIQEVMECDLKKSIAIFHLLRDRRRKIIIHNRLTGFWSGEQSIDLRLAIRTIERKLADVIKRLEEVEKENKDLFDRVFCQSK